MIYTWLTEISHDQNIHIYIYCLFIYLSIYLYIYVCDVNMIENMFMFWTNAAAGALLCKNKMCKNKFA